MTEEYKIGLNNPRYKEKVQTEQYRISEILLNKRFELSLEFEEMSKIAEMNQEEYIKLEYADLDIEVKVYEEALKKIELYERSHGFGEIAVDYNPAKDLTNKSFSINLNINRKKSGSNEFKISQKDIIKVA